MATDKQTSFIADLVVLKTKEFKEVKELLLSSGIVSANAETVKNAQTVAEVAHALTKSQAHNFIELLNATKTPARGRAYSSRRVESTIGALDDIKATIDEWSFDGLQ